MRPNSQGLGESSPAGLAQRPVNDEPAGERPADIDWQALNWEAGWLTLFDQTSFGWRGLSPLRVDNGRLILRPQRPFARTSAQFSRFELAIRYRLPPGSQAELLLVTNPTAEEFGIDHIAIPLSPEFTELYLSRPHVEPSGTGDRSPPRVTMRWSGGQGPAVETGGGILHGPDVGYLGFRVQVGQLEVEQVRLRPLWASEARYQVPFQDARWDATGLGAAHMQVDGDVFTLQGGPGFLATQPTYQDFILSVDCRTQPETNSGVFFRCIPGEKLNGYESQIHNGMLDGDPARPADCGTGGIFRRIDARRVVAADQQWFRKVLVVCGGQISVWVNGYQVTDWSDQRKPDVNPRRGRRLEAGTVMFQAHDPGTHVEFKNFQIETLGTRHLNESNQK
jgi:hypothetical protein